MNILWDFDGTLFDTYPAYTTIFKEILDHEIDDEVIFSKLKISFTHAARHFNLSESQIKEIFRLEEHLQPEQTPPFTDVEAILQRANRNVIMTHKNRSEVNKLIEYYGWTHYFVDIVAGDDGFPKKPDPASYVYLHHRNRMDLIIGDREIDILPGKAMGPFACWYWEEFDSYRIYFLTRVKRFIEMPDGFETTGYVITNVETAIDMIKQIEGREERIAASRRAGELSRQVIPPTSQTPLGK
ncbi:HAD-IA family hydrolase [Paenibacillus mendelii]|uniref:HAD-IA family hydrolase n=1 Tax=Paenibacillus mendelii TaxID=206163 RepID=A0ABV6JBH7_9BACL|nr:HAD-IA family hydrolase [Paenibacillus mendelii]MCQ6562998.1 HAD-IA family hydrolase [Paenibacillus mendelii]